MKRIGLLSDTHSYWDDKYEDYFKDCDEIWHAGDVGNIAILDRLAEIKPIRAVSGNIDDARLRASYPDTIRFSLEGVDIYMTHIGGYPGRYSPNVLKVMQSRPPQLFICGHSHILKVMFDKKYHCLTINPGAAGKYGFHRIRTLIRFSLDDGNIKDLEVIELSN